MGTSLGQMVLMCLALIPATLEERLFPMAPRLEMQKRQLQIIEVEGYERANYGFGVPNGSQAENYAITAQCNASEADRTLSFTQTLDLSIGDLVQAAPVFPGGDSAAAQERFLEILNAALAETGDTAPSFSVSISGSVGATYRSLISGAVSLSVGGSEVGSSSYAGSTSGLTNIAAVSINPTAVPVLDTNSKISATISGQVTLSCSDQDSTSEFTASSNVGLPGLVVYGQPPVDGVD